MAAKEAPVTLDSFEFDHPTHVLTNELMVVKPFKALAHHVADVVKSDSLAGVLQHLLAARDAALTNLVEESE